MFPESLNIVRYSDNTLAPDDVNAVLAIRYEDVDARNGYLGDVKMTAPHDIMILCHDKLNLYPESVSIPYQWGQVNVLGFVLYLLKMHAVFRYTRLEYIC